MREDARGPFIVFEGIDGAGTTTQCRLLSDRLRRERPDRRVAVTAEPSGGPVGAMIRHVLRERVVGTTALGERASFDRRALALLFAADRLDHVACEIEPLVAAGWVVVSDRYVLSSVAYQGMDAPRAWVETLNSFAPPPDMLVFLDTPVDVAWERIRSSRAGRDVFEAPDTLRRVAAAYRDALPATRAARVVTIPGDLSVDEIAEAVWREVSPLV
ncbi:MAG: dTMP kinase [Deltaproteobacteria bacterium]|nr:dTMP kinase [Deltaproteobacteria bacterium]